MAKQEVIITIDQEKLKGLLSIPPKATGIVLFAHGSGSGRLSPRNQFVAEKLQHAGLATLLMDLLTDEEDAIDQMTRQFRFDIELLTERLVGTTGWLTTQENTKQLKAGYFGASTGAAAALMAASELGDKIKAVVSRGGRPDLAEDALEFVKAPTLLIVGGDDSGVIELNQKALDALKIEKKLEIVKGATHLFEEPGALDQVADLAAKWFLKYLV
jgi:dienelactone hydrolase